MGSPPMVLEIVKGDWGIPSVDVQCLEILTIAKISGAPLEVIVTGPTFRKPRYVLPVFRHGETVLTRTYDIIEYFKKMNFDADIRLSNKERADVAAYKSLLFEKLYPALLFIWWANPRNYDGFTRSWYARTAPFPLGVFHAYRKRNKVMEFLQEIIGEDREIRDAKTSFLADATLFLTTLNNLLKENDYFLPSGPSSLDAVVYSYLAILLIPPLPDNALKYHIESCHHLMRFVTNFNTTYFIDTLTEYEERKARESNTFTAVNEEFPQKRTIFFAGTVAFGAMLAYAKWSGLLKITGSSE